MLSRPGGSLARVRWGYVVAILSLAGLGVATAQAFSVALSVAPVARGSAIVAAAASSDLASFGAVRLRGRADLALSGGATVGGAMLIAARQDGVDVYAGGGVGFGAVATSGSRETFVAPYWLVGLRAPLTLGLGLVLEARATPRVGTVTFAFGLDLGFGP